MVLGRREGLGTYVRTGGSLESGKRGSSVQTDWPRGPRTVIAGGDFLHPLAGSIGGDLSFSLRNLPQGALTADAVETWTEGTWTEFSEPSETHGFLASPVPVALRPSSLLQKLLETAVLPEDPEIASLTKLSTGSILCRGR
ncbi:hypothetical protein PoB_002874800 [Plakobranchus ocellatus]|uniref:Uncharacterized protein n=1 Tax=Plakobranchus ocellatus TaxID=259542 RepID=A0AAV4A4W6_9GAST|nr:hypothetical protein PoB_002874800 [Plakobranchus ocellatus]